MKYIMCAKTFPVYHPKAGQLTRFKESILGGTKLHTLRNSAGNRKTGDVVSLREWEGMPYRSKQREFARCKIEVVPESIVNGTPDLYEIRNLARCDGFNDPRDFQHWFTKGKNEPINFEGVCIWFLGVLRIPVRP